MGGEREGGSSRQLRSLSLDDGPCCVGPQRCCVQIDEGPSHRGRGTCSTHGRLCVAARDDRLVVPVPFGWVGVCVWVCLCIYVCVGVYVSVSVCGGCVRDVTRERSMCVRVAPTTTTTRKTTAAATRRRQQQPENGTHPSSLEPSGYVRQPRPDILPSLNEPSKMVLFARRKRPYPWKRPDWNCPE